MADGTEFSIDIDAKSSSVEPAAAAVARLAERLTASGAAASQAAEAVKAGQAAYASAETAATRAATALEKIGLAAEAQKGKLAAAAESGNINRYNAALEKMNALTERQGAAGAKAASTLAAMNSAASALDTLKGSAAAAADNESRLSKALDATKASASAASKAESEAAKAASKAAADEAKAAGKAGAATKDAGDEAAGGSVNFRALSGALGKLGGPLGSIGSQAAGVGGALQKMSKTLGDAGPYVAAAVVAVAVVVALAAVAAAAVVATVKIAAWAVGLADANRTASLLSAGIAGTVKGGAALDAKFDDLANKVPIARDELANMASELAKTGLTGKALTDQLEVTATRAAKLKFGPDFAKQLLSIDSQATRLKANISQVFGGLKIDALLEAFSHLVKLFDASDASGKAIKAVFESLFQPLIDGVTAFIPKMVTAFIQFEILVMKAMIAIKPFGSTILWVAEAVGIVALAMGVMLAGALTAVIAPFVVLAGLVAGFIAGILSMVYAIYSAGMAVIAFGASLMGSMGGAIDYLTNLSLADIGTNLVDGLVGGIVSAGPKVLQAITGLASGAIDGAKKLLGIASPSKVFAEIGMHTAAGMAQGVDDHAGDVQGSIESMVSPPDASASGAAAAGASAPKGGGGPVYNITINGVSGDAKSFAEAFRDALQDLNTQSGGAHA